MNYITQSSTSRFVNNFEVSTCQKLIKNRNLRLGESELFLAQIRLEQVTTTKISHIRQSSEELIDELLETQLGDVPIDYMTLTVTCKHSALPNHKGKDAVTNGCSSYGTYITVEARAAIRRHSSMSPWTRPNSEYGYHITDSRIIDLVKSHYSFSKSQDVIRIMTAIPIAEPLSLYQQHQSSDTTRNLISEIVTPSKRTVAALSHVSPPRVSRDITEEFIFQPESPHVTPRASEEIDPARAIWNSMRRSSQSARKTREKKSDSEETRDQKLLEFEKGIMNLALKNKRSIGADTIRSMATPSTKVGLGTGRSRAGWGSGWLW
jgi:hypothetical protein